MRVLLLGAGGMLASDLAASVPPGVQLVSHSKSQTDITAEDAVALALRDARPDVVINCAAYTNVDGAETARDRAFAVNGRAPGIIGRAVGKAGGRALVVHYSTDYVFNGRGSRPYREEDGTDPLGVYGASKLAGEEALRDSGAPYLIIRTQWLFGRQGRSFPRTMWERARAGKPTKVVNDQVGRPTYTVDLAAATWNVIGKRITDNGQRVSLLHVANAGTATWYDVARRVFQAAGGSAPLTPCATAEYPTPARRPAYSVLDTARHASLAAGELPPWQDAVERFLDQLKAEAAA